MHTRDADTLDRDGAAVDAAAVALASALGVPLRPRPALGRRAAAGGAGAARRLLLVGPPSVYRSALELEAAADLLVPAVALGDAAAAVPVRAAFDRLVRALGAGRAEVGADDWDLRLADALVAGQGRAWLAKHRLVPLSRALAELVSDVCGPSPSQATTECASDADGSPAKRARVGPCC